MLQEESLTSGGEGERKRRGKGRRSEKRRDREEAGVMVATAGDKGERSFMYPDMYMYIHV